MSQLPVIIGFGGISPAGRSSFHHGYRRLVMDRLGMADREPVLKGLTTLTGRARWHQGHFEDAEGQPLDTAELQALAEGTLADTLIRRIHPDWHDIDAVPCNSPAQVTPAESGCCFRVRRRQLPDRLPPGWELSELGQGWVEVCAQEKFEWLLSNSRRSSVRAAGLLPTGFRPGELYQSRNHPRALQMTVYGASDALNSSGIPWELLRQHLPADQVAVYAGNSIGQLDDCGFGGLLKAAISGRRTTSKQMPLGYGQMPADFINAYLLGNLGATGSSLGACATFLYNLHNGVADIRSGRRRLVLVGASDAPVTPEIIEGFRAMGALAEEKGLLALDRIQSLSDDDYRRTSRPFASNCGFTLGEAAQFVLLCDDHLALELGAEVLGSVPDVFVNADGHKKSISAPGIGNYITLGRATALVETLLGSESLRQRSFVQAHGTSTPQNRITESHVLNETARAFGIDAWPVAAVKSYLGHSQGTAGGDQLMASLGVWQYGLIPGIQTLDRVAEDVHASHLQLSQTHQEVGAEGMDAAVLNSKGFGGNNASAAVLSPGVTLRMLQARHGEEAMNVYRERREEVRANAAEYDQEAILGLNRPIYRFGQNVLEGKELKITREAIEVPGYDRPISLRVDTPFADLFKNEH